MRLPTILEILHIKKEFSKAYDEFKPKVAELYSENINPELRVLSMEKFLEKSNAELGRPLHEIDEENVYLSNAEYYAFTLLGDLKSESVWLNPFSPVWAKEIDLGIKSFKNTCTHELLHSVFANILSNFPHHMNNGAMLALNEGFVEYTTHHIIPDWFSDETKSLRKRTFDLCARSGFSFEADKENTLHLTYFPHSIGYRFYMNRFGSDAKVGTIKDYLEDIVGCTNVKELTKEFNQFAMEEFNREFPSYYQVLITRFADKELNSDLLQIYGEDPNLFPRADVNVLAGIF